MASNTDLVQYISDQCSGAGQIDVKKMMGDWCIYCNGILFGLICDNNLYIKVTEPGKTVLRELDLRPPYPGAKDHFYISDIDDSDYLTELIKVTLPALPVPKPKKKPALKDMIQEGLNSGNVEDFDSKAFLKEIKTRHSK